MKWIKKIYQRLTEYLRTRFNRVQFVMYVAVLVGLVAGIVAVTLKIIVHYLQEWIKEIPVSGMAYLFFPAIGLLLTVLIVQVFFGGQIERGIAMVLKAIARRSSFIPMKHTYMHAVTSSITVGLGGSVGLEAPIVATGSAIGSNLARISDLNYRERSLLIACGAAAGIAAVFNAPIAGVIFAIEILLTETIVSYFIPLIISSVVGALCSRIILKESILFNFALKQNFNYNNVPFYILLGVLAGFVSLYYARTFKSAERRIHNLKINVYAKAIAGGFLLVILYFGFQPLFGEGYDVVKSLAGSGAANFSGFKNLISVLGEEKAIIIFTACIVLLKPLAAAITIGSGGNGGNFAPSLFTGAFLGFFFARLFNLFPWFKLPVGNFSLVGMAGVLSGVMYCPLTAIFLIAEITNGYELIIPLMIVSSISYFIVKHYEPYSMDIKKLAMEGQIFTHQREKNILTAISSEEMIQQDYPWITSDKTLGDVIELIKQTDKNIFAVVDQKGNFAGIIELNDIKKQLFQPELFSKVSVRQLMKRPAGIIYSGEDMKSIMEKFDITQSWYLPVLTKDKKFIGFISKTIIFNKYREILAGTSDLYEE